MDTGYGALTKDIHQLDLHLYNQLSLGVIGLYFSLLYVTRWTCFLCDSTCSQMESYTFGIGQCRSHCLLSQTLNRLIWHPTVLHWSECSSCPHGNLFTCEYLWSENGLASQKTFKFRGLELKRFTRPVVYSCCQNGFETAVQKLISVELQCWLFPLFALRIHRSLLSFCSGSHAAGYDSDPSTPMVYSCSTQYRIHTHGVFRGIQVGLILLLLLTMSLFSLLRCHHGVTQAFCLHKYTVIFAVHASCQDQDVHTRMTYWKLKVNVTNTGGKTH